MLEIITFTGVDAHTDLEELREIAREYPQAEFAVLFGSQTSGDNPIFPPAETVRALRNLDGVNTALHLCGKYARMAAGEMRTIWPVKLKARGFGRIQVNLHGDEQDPGESRSRSQPSSGSQSRLAPGASSSSTGDPGARPQWTIPGSSTSSTSRRDEARRASSTGRTRPETGALATPAGSDPTTSGWRWSSRRDTRRPGSGSTWNETSGTRTTGSTWTR